MLKMGWLWQRLVLETVVLLSVSWICAAAATISTTTQKAGNINTYMYMYQGTFLRSIPNLDNANRHFYLAHV